MAGKLILVTGAGGYIGARLIPLLLERGYRVRALFREPSLVRSWPWIGQVQTVTGDVLDGPILEQAMQDVSGAYYLIHSMAFGRSYHQRDLSAAQAFAQAAGREGVEQIVYLGGLANPQDEIGAHMRSRLQTGEVLRQGRVPVTELRAGVIVGPGSISFEMIRYLTEQLPLLVGPRWLRNRVQPIAVEDVLAYLLAALETPESRGGSFEIGGREVMTFAEAMRIYARLRGLRRSLLVLPGLPVGWMAFGVDRLTPVPASIAAPLIDGMRSDSVVRDDAALRVFPGIRPQGYGEAVAEALSALSPADIGPIFDNPPKRIKIIRQAGFLIDARRTYSRADPPAVYRTFTRLGGKRGWLYLNGLWRLRGLLDRLIGGPGLRGRSSEGEAAVGEMVDFYRLEALEPGRLMRLKSEMKAPGEGWMEWRITPQPAGGSLLEQTAYFAPKGLAGFLYWYGLYPVHSLVFAGLLKAIANQTGQIDESE
jgi:uncharacterized protein YbjT (DUF2867 family)